MYKNINSIPRCTNCVSKWRHTYTASTVSPNLHFFLVSWKNRLGRWEVRPFPRILPLLPLNQSQFHRTAFVQKRRTIYCGYNFVLVGVPIDTDIEKKYCNYSSCFVRCRGCRRCRATKRQMTILSLSVEKVHWTWYGWSPRSLTFVINTIRNL